MIKQTKSIVAMMVAAVVMSCSSPQAESYTLAQFDGSLVPESNEWIVAVGDGCCEVTSEAFAPLRSAIEAAKSPVKLTLTGEAQLPAEALSGCTNLYSVDISAFADVPAKFLASSSVRVITLGKGIKSIGDEAMRGCAELVEVSNNAIDDHDEAYAARCSNKGSVGKFAFANCPKLERLDLSQMIEFGEGVVCCSNAITLLDLSAYESFTFAVAECEDGVKMNTFSGFANAANCELLLNAGKYLVATTQTPAADMTEDTWATQITKDGEEKIIAWGEITVK